MKTWPSDRIPVNWKFSIGEQPGFPGDQLSDDKVAVNWAMPVFIVITS